MPPSPHHPPASPHRHRIWLVAALTVAAGACAGSDDGGATATTPTASPVTESSITETSTAPDTTVDGADDPVPPGCLDPDAVAGLVGTPVDVSATGGGAANTSGLSYSYSGCSYGLTAVDGEVAEGVVGIVRVQVDGDGFAFDLLSDDARVAADEDGFEPIEDLGDEAWRDGTTYAVRQGPSMFFAELITAPTDSDAVAGSLTAILAEAMVPLDLEAPPNELCEAVEGAVADALGPVDSVSSSQGGVMVDDVNFATNGCDVQLVDGAEAIIDVANAEPWDAWAEAKGASSFTKGYEGLTIGQLSAYDTGDELVVDDGEEPLRITTEDLDLEPDDAAKLRLDLAELALGV